MSKICFHGVKVILKKKIQLKNTNFVKISEGPTSTFEKLVPYVIIKQGIKKSHELFIFSPLAPCLHVIMSTSTYLVG